MDIDSDDSSDSIGYEMDTPSPAPRQTRRPPSSTSHKKRPVEKAKEQPKEKEETPKQIKEEHAGMGEGE